MKTVTADQESRVRIPEILPNQEFIYDSSSTGVITLVPISCKTEERFPPGSLRQYVTEEDNKEMLAIFKGCSIAGPE
jgi:hypothetical protein